MNGNGVRKMNEKDICEIYCYDEEKVTRIQDELQTVDIDRMAQLFKAVAVENRAKITFALLKGEEVCVCDIANIIGITIANTSHHLRTLYTQGVVTFRKEGRLAFYSLDDEHVEQLFENALAHEKEGKLNV